MNPMSFISWYYGQGLKGFLSVWKNFLWYMFHLFNIKGLFFTLFSSWKKDMMYRDWQGWHPILSLQVAVTNFVFRIYGAIARMVFILAGLLCALWVVVVGAVLFIIYVFAPLVLIVVPVLFLQGYVYTLVTFAGLLLMMPWIFRGYFASRRVPLVEMTFDQMERTRIFPRLLHRLGMVPDQYEPGTLADPDKRVKLLSSVGLTDDDFHHIVAWEIYTVEKKVDSRRFWDRAHLRRSRPIGKHWQYGYTSLLNRFSVDLTKYDTSSYSDLTELHHKEEFSMLKLVLTKPNQNSAMLISPPGAGKRLLIHALARLIRENRIDEPELTDKRIVVLDLGSALSSASSLHVDLGNYVHRLFTEAAYAGNVIMVIEGIEKYLGKAQDEFHFDISPLLEQYLSAPTFQVIATTTPAEYHSLIEKNKAIMQHFETIEVRELSPAKSIEVVLETFAEVETDHVMFTYDALRTLIKRSEQIYDAVVLPQRAIDLVNELLLVWMKKPTKFITSEFVDEYISTKTGIPVGRIGKGEQELLLNMETYLHKRVIGQNEAISQIAQAIRKVRSGISNSKKPISSFLFLGPTGVGKTESAKALAEAYFGNEQRMIRLDMSEFQSLASLDWLIGSTQTRQPGRLITQAKDNPFSLLLLDEIEKAHPNILDLFLQILDEGMITDAFGEKVSFRNMIIIATSNAGSTVIRDLVAANEPGEQIRKRVIDHIIANNLFRIEFLNRFDGIIYFSPLSPDDLTKVVALMLKNLSKRIYEEKNIKVTFDDNLVPVIIEKGYEPMFGARSINRYIGDTIEDSIAKKIIAQDVSSGAAINVSTEDLMVSA